MGYQGSRHGLGVDTIHDRGPFLTRDSTVGSIMATGPLKLGVWAQNGCLNAALYLQHLFQI